MSSDFRFHIASLAAVFLALGLGILVGTFFVGAPVVERQIRSLNRNLSTSVSELRRQTQEAEKNEEALSGLLPQLVARKLSGRKVLVVQTGDYADAAEQTEQALTLAGASVTRITLPREAWLDRLAAGTESTAAAAAAAEQIAPLLVTAGSGGDTGALDALRRDGLLTGKTPDAPFRLAVLVGGAEALSGPKDARDPLERARTLDAALAKAWQAAGVAVVGVEPLGADVSYMRAYQAQGIATVDNIDRAAGRIALPFALLGEKAAYGMKGTAERVLPASLEDSPGAEAP